MKIEVWGEYALFTRPEFHSERMSYDVMTPSAARGLLEAILWHPGMTWVIDRIYVLNPIKFGNMRCNEVSACLNSNAVKRVFKGKNEGLCLSTSDNIQQRANTLLRHVRYVIEAHIALKSDVRSGDTVKKFTAMAQRRVEKGQFFHQPYFGIREYPAYFQPWPEDREIVTAYPNSDKDLGIMLYDMDYSNTQNIRPMFFEAKLKRGILDLTECEVIKCS